MYTNGLYLVTGALGHLGNTIIEKLVEKGCAVRGFALPNDQATTFSSPLVEIVRGDVRDKESLRALFADTDGASLTVIHTAGIVSIASKYQQRVYDVNVEGTRHVVELCREYGVSKLVHVSSVHAIPERPKGETIKEISRFSPRDVVGLYAQTKSKASQLVLDAAKEGLNACVVHPSGIIGPGDYGHGHLTQLVMDYIDGRLTASVEGGYDFVDVRDVADGILACAESGRAGECYILSNRYCAVPELLQELHRLTGKREVKTVLPLWFAKLTAPLAEAYYKLRKQPPLYTAYSLYTLNSNAHFSHEKATKELRYQPRPLTETLRDTVCWLREHNRVKV